MNGESNNIWNAIKVSNGNPVYTNPEDLPLEIFQYTPLSQFPTVAAASFLESSDKYYVHRITVFGRLSQLALNLLSCYLLFQLCLLIPGFNKALSWLVALVFLTVSMHNLFTIRPDSTSLAFTLAGISLFVIGYVKQKRFQFYLSGVIIGGSFLAKQDALLVAVPIGLTLLLRREWGLLVKYTAVTTFAFIFSLAVGRVFFGEYFLMSVFGGVNNPMNISNATYAFQRVLMFQPLHLLVGNLAIVNILAQRPNKTLTIICIICVMLEIIPFLTTFKTGSGMYYYTAFLAISTIPLIYWLNDLWRKFNLSSISGFIAIGMASFVTAGQIAFHYTSPWLKPNASKSVYDSSFDEVSQIRNAINLQENTKVLVADPLHRNFLAEHSIAVNMEYYGVSSFDYSNYRESPDKGIDYIILKKGGDKMIRSVMRIFSIEESDYQNVAETSSFIIKQKINSGDH